MRGRTRALFGMVAGLLVVSAATEGTQVQAQAILCSDFVKGNSTEQGMYVAGISAGLNLATLLVRGLEFHFDSAQVATGDHAAAAQGAEAAAELIEGYHSASFGLTFRELATRTAIYCRRSGFAEHAALAAFHAAIEELGQ